MIKHFKKILTIIITLLVCVNGTLVHGQNSIGLVNVKELSFRAKPGGTILLDMEYGTPVTLTGENGDWYSAYIYNNNQKLEGYVYKASIKKYTVDSSFESKISAFPDTYKQALRYVHCLQPTWTINAINTNIDFNTATNGFQRSAAVDGSDTALRAGDSPVEGNNWYRANAATTAYFLDPRNSLNASRILQFQSMTRDESTTLEDVQKTLKDTYMDSIAEGDETWAQLFMRAASETNMSPIHLAIMALQEQGTTGVGGLGSQGGNVNGTVYYNVFNVGATSGAQDGINYAATNGWTTRYISIVEGAKKIAQDYVNKGQDSYYLRRFNVSPNRSYSDPYSHCYMTNIRAPYSEAWKYLKSLYDMGKLSSSMTLNIPIYTNMPAYTSYPGTKTQLTLEVSEAIDQPITPVTYNKGDVDGNGGVSAVDYVLIKNHIMKTSELSGDRLARADVNGDGAVNAADYVLIKNHIMGVSKLF